MALTEQIGHTISQLEVTADLINKSAIEYLFEYEQKKGLPTTEELKGLATKLGISHFYITNNQG